MKLQTHISSLSPQGDGHDLLGIFTDPMTVKPHAHRTLGVVRQPSHSERGSKSKPAIKLFIPTARHYDPSSLAAHSINCTFVNKASFSGVNYLQIQRAGPRCTGILIACDNGSLSTLGQWYPSQTDGISSLYQDSKGPLKSISFIYSSTEETVEKFVQEILVNEDEPDSMERQRFTCNNPNIVLSNPPPPSPLLTFDMIITKY